MPQFFVNRKIEPNEKIEIRGADARHITQSLRLGPHDSLVLSDGRGRSFLTRIDETGPGRVTITVQGEIERREAAPAPALAMASIRPERMEQAVEKAVELGCSLVIPFNSARTVRRTAAGSGSRRQERLCRIAAEAAKQSGLPFLPKVEAPRSFEELCGEIRRFDTALLFHEAEDRLSLRSALSAKGGVSRGSGIVVIGPEGGFTDDEVRAARESGSKVVGLGRQILRAETAAIVAIAIYQYESGNMDLC